MKLRDCPICGTATTTSLCGGCSSALVDRGLTDQLPDPDKELPAAELLRLRGLLRDVAEATRYRVEVGHTVYVGVVQGAGGPLCGRAGLARLHHAARGGLSTLVEPRPGHVRLYPDYSASSSGPALDVPVVGAFITIEPGRRG